MQKTHSTVPHRPVRSTQADQEPTTSGKTHTRSAVIADLSSAGTRGKKTQATLKDSRSNINNEAKAKGWLIKEELLIEGETVSPTALSQALMWLAAGEKNTVEQLVDGIRAVALCLESWEGVEAVEETRKVIKDTAVEWTEEAKKEMKRIAEGVIAEVKTSLESTEKRGRSGNWADDVETENFQHKAITDIAKAIPTYAQVIANEWRKDTDKKEERVHHDYMAKESIRRRRVLVDGMDGIQSSTGGLTPKEIVEKANIALAAAAVSTEGYGEELAEIPSAVAAKILENGGVVIEMDTEEAADWVRSEDVRREFEANFGGSAKVKDQLHLVVVNFLPVTLRDSLEEAAPRIESDNTLPTDCIAHCRWLKAPKFWSKGQRFAHALIAVKGRMAASLLIRDGVILEGQRFRVRKMLEEPKRCYKCQRLGHTATGCKEIHEICPNCAGAHSGKDCDRTPDKYRCANCLKARLKPNHAVWDRDCPSMQEERRKKAERDPSSKYKFFPTEEEWTWERKDDDTIKTSTASGANAGYGTGGGRTADHGWDWAGVADGGWEGMRAKKTLDEVVGNIERWKTVGARGNKGKGRDDGGAPSATQGGSIGIPPTSQPGQTSQVNRTSSHSRMSSRTRQEATSGRQSVLGEYWSQGTSGERQPETRQENATPADNLC
jgi:hypothetical protein